MKSSDIESILRRFPKKRLQLSSAQKARHRKDYISNRDGSDDFVGKAALAMEGWMHRRVAVPFFRGKTLEVGAGTLNHLPFEALGSGHVYDVVEPFTELYLGKDQHISKVNNFYSSLKEVPSSNRYDRVISVAVLEHMTELPSELEVMDKLLSPNGLVQAAFPSEGGFLWGVGWRVTTGFAYGLRTKMSYKNVMRHEHVNSASEIISLMNHYFDITTVKRSALGSEHTSFYTFVEARKKHIE